MLSAASAGIYAALNVAAVTDLATGGICDDVGPGATFPFVLYEVQETPQFHLGSQPGRSGQLVQVDLLVHVFSQYAGMKEAQRLMHQVIGALVALPTIAQYATWAIFYDETIPLGDQIVAAVKVKELVARFRLFVELQ